MKLFFFIPLIVFFTLSGTSTAQQNDLIFSPWKAKWIGPTENSQDYGVYHFRKTFSIPTKPGEFKIHISADNRCKLFINGQLCFIGPTRGDTYHWNYETIDIAPYLQSGNNTIAALVWNFGSHKPLAQQSIRTGLIIQGDTEKENIVNTNSHWKFYHNKSYSPLKPELTYVYYVGAPGDQVDFNLFPQGWQHPEFNDTTWKQASEIGTGLPKGVFDWSLSWMLVPSTLPQMERTLQRFNTVREITGINVPTGFPKQKIKITIPPNTTATLLLDQGQLTNAYPVLEFSNGKQARIHLHYAEALFIKQHDSIDWGAQKSKGNRNEVAGKRFVGVADELISNGNIGQQFIPLDWKTFRYVKITITTQEEALVLDDVYSIFTAYPFKLAATFSSSDPTLETIFQTGWRTARLCAEETYMDTPLYERLQYFGDTRIQALVTLFNSSDDRLVRNAIRLGDQSRIAEGITKSRYPSREDQLIPPFSLWWIGMVHDYYLYRSDTAFIKEFLPGIRQVLTFFQRYQQQDGRLKNVPYWLFTDWVSINGWDKGMPPLGKDGCSAVLDLQLLFAFKLAEELETDLGMSAYADMYKREANRLKESITRSYWNESLKVFSDTHDKEVYSQHTQALALLCKTVPEHEKESLALQLLHNKTLTPATIYFLYYVNRALAESGLGNQYVNQLGIWKESLTMGLTTWPEISDMNNTRSDCHAWGASPNIELLRIVLGIDSAEPRFKTVRIKPHLGKLKSASGSIPHPNGVISAQYSLNKKGMYETMLTLPAGVSGKLIWKDRTYDLHSGENQFLLPQ